MQFTYARDATVADIKAGKYGGKVRITGLKQNMNADLPWTTLEAAVAPKEAWAISGGGSSNASVAASTSDLDQFSATCLYFGTSLYEPAGSDPIGLVHTAWGGSTIEEWVRNEDIAQCKGASVRDDNERLYDFSVLPYVDMTVKGWVFYQGENNCGGMHGNSGTATQVASGYACLMPKMVELWRSKWSAEPGTTDPNAAFGVVSLSAGDSEGAPDMGSFRWAQQGAFGTLPNKLMPNTFMAHAHDLSDPWNGNTGACLKKPAGMEGYDCTTPFFMGPGIHPRLKKPVGQRLALGALQAAYGRGSGVAGGTVSGCALDVTSAAQTLTLKFNMPAGRALTVRPYNSSNPENSATSVQVNATDGSAKWLPVHIKPGAVAGTITVELPAGTTPTAVRYAWGDTKLGQGKPNGDDVKCCEGNGVDEPCMMGQCPLLAAEPLAPFGGLPVDPFIAKIVDGKCLCPEPQVCDA